MKDKELECQKTIVGNLNWLIPMAKSGPDNWPFIIQETYDKKE